MGISTLKICLRNNDARRYNNNYHNVSYESCCLIINKENSKIFLNIQYLNRYFSFNYLTFSLLLLYTFEVLNIMDFVTKINF